MRANPIYKRERTVSSRSARIPVILTVFNSILAFAALLNMYSMVAQVELTAEIQYVSFMEIYVFGAAIIFVVILFIVPAMTAGSISGERERKTLDLLLSTQVTGLEVAAGKLMASLYYVLLMQVSSLPVMALSFVYGGIELWDLAFLLISFLATALFVACIGICFSAVCRKTTLATAVSYGVLAFFLAGTYGINGFIWSMANMGTAGYVNQVGGLASQVNSGGFLYLLLLNPAVTFYEIVRNQMGWREVFSSPVQWFGRRQLDFLEDAWVPLSISLQILTAVLFLAAAVWCLSPELRRGGFFRKGKKRGKEHNEGVHI